MKPVDQTIVCSERGDCARAAVASLFELEIIQVPHFQLFKSQWFDVYYYFFRSLGYEYIGYARPGKNILALGHSIDGFFDATVQSKTFKDRKHAVVIDITGKVVHDPNPNKIWQGIDILKSGELEGWYMFKRIEENENAGDEK